MANSCALVWLRRDLRCDDHAALYHALRRFERVYCAFVFDTDILDALPASRTGAWNSSTPACCSCTARCRPCLPVRAFRVAG
jgi:hypothetical protein